MGDHLFDVEVMRKTMVLTCPTSRVKLSKSKMRTSPPLLVLYEWAKGTYDNINKALENAPINFKREPLKVF